MSSASPLAMSSSVSLPDLSISSMLPPSATLKRKLDDAMQTLDDATSEHSDRTMPPKKSRSIYSTLVKYGIKSKDSKSTIASNRLQSLSKSAPHLAAILARSSSKRPTFSPTTSTASLTTAPPSSNEYRPTSTTCFLSRLSTFRLATYVNKPPQIDAVAAAKCGWINDGRDRLACGVCKASWVVASTQGMNREAANSLVEKQRVQLVSAHKDTCPWKAQQCDASVYRLPVQSPAATTKEVKARALDLEPILEDVQIKHPLTATQVQAFMSTLTTFNVARPRSVTPEGSPPPSSPSEAIVFDHQEEPSVTAALTSLFGWNLPPLPSADQPASSRASSVAPTTPMLSRASSMVSLRTMERSGTPQLSASFSSRRDSKQHRDTSLLYCRMCQRRVGLWAFGPGASETQRRQFDLLKEHRPYCPYAVRSTTVPSLPMPSGHSAILNGAVTSSGAPLAEGAGQDAPVEGWKAILSIILKSKKRANYSRQSSTRTSGLEKLSAGEEEMDVDRVEAMVDGVRRSGGKELLQYVKGLLG